MDPAPAPAGCRSEAESDGGGSELMQAPGLAMEFLRLGDVGKSQAHSVGHNRKTALQFPYVPHAGDMWSATERGRLEQHVVCYHLTVDSPEHIPVKRPRRNIGVAAAQAWAQPRHAKIGIQTLTEAKCHP